MDGHLYEAYEKIQSIYHKENYSVGSLRHIGFISKWVTIDATNAQSGMAFNFSGEHSFYGPEQPRKLLDLKSFIGEDLFSLAEYLLPKEHIIMRASCLAVLNALSCPLTEPSAMKRRGISLGREEDYCFIEEDDYVAVVGYGGVVSHLSRLGIPYHVLDMRPMDSLGHWSIGKEIKRGPESVTFHNLEDTEEVLSQADILFITGSSLVNASFKSLVDQARKARIIAMFGPSAGILPEYLLDNKVNYVLSSRCVDRQGIFYSLSNYAGRRNLKNTVEDYIIEAF